MAQKRERNTPRISVNKLGEYMTAPPRRRRRIVGDQKRPKDFIVPRYTEAQEAIAAYLTDSKRDAAIIRREIRRLNAETPSSEWDAQKNQLCVEALESFLDIADEIDLEEVEATRGQNEPPRLQVAGVLISVRPEIVLRGRDRAGKGTVGAIKICLSKNVPLGQEAGLYVGTVLHRFVQEHLDGKADPQRCLVLDVFDGEVYSAPRSYVRRLKDIEAACEEIARAWPFV